MSEYKHTAGEWLRIGRLVYALMPAGWSKGVERFKNRITITVSHDRECPEEEAEACARLIAAAPTMLEALERIQMRATDHPDDDLKDLKRQMMHIAAIAKDAIAKATGAA